MIQERYYRFIQNLPHTDGSAFAEKFQRDLVRVTPNFLQNGERDYLAQVIPFNR
jgi:hypothetical protein